MRAGRLLIAVLGLLSASHLVSAATRDDGRPWWDEKRRAYPQCNAMTDEHERLTDELERLWDVAKQSVEPQRAAYVRQINATAKKRNAEQDKLFACIRASGGRPATAESGQKRPPLQGKAEETETPPSPPAGPPPGGTYNPGPDNPGVVVPTPERPGVPPVGGPPGTPGAGPSPSGPGGSPPGGSPPERPAPGVPPRRPSPIIPGHVADGPVPTRDGPSLERGLRRGFVECGQVFRNLGLAALSLVHPKFILENRNYVEAAKYLGVQSSDQGLRFLFHEATAPTLRGGLDWAESCDRKVGDEEAGLRIARRLCFWALPNPTYKALKGARPKARPQQGLPGSPTNPLTEAEVMEGLGQFNRPDLSGQTIKLPRPNRGFHLGIVTLGERLGEGKIKDVYVIDGRPGLTVQLVHHLKDAAQSVRREMHGYDLIKNDIPTPTIHAHRGVAGGLSYMIKDRLPSEAFFSEPTAELLAGMGETQGKLAQGKRVWIDGHVQNHYLTRDAQGRPVIGIHDTDMITRASDPAIAAEMSRLVPLFQRKGPAGFKQLCEFNKAAQAGALDGAALMREVWRLRNETEPPF
jgi:hypothetical protein